MSGRKQEFEVLETRLRAEAPADGGLSELARAQLRERLAGTAPDPGTPSTIGGRRMMIAAVVLLGVTMSVVMVVRNGNSTSGGASGSQNGSTNVTPVVVDRSLGEGIRDRLSGWAENVTRETPMLEEARRVAADVNALRTVFRERAALLGWNPAMKDG